MTGDYYDFAVVVVLRFRFDRLEFHGSIGFHDFRKQALRKKMIQVLDDGNAVANAVDEEHRRTWDAGSDYQYPLRCEFVLLNFGILP